MNNRSMARPSVSTEPSASGFKPVKVHPYNRDSDAPYQENRHGRCSQHADQQHADQQHADQILPNRLER
jgi:hypothetical protein